MVEALLLKPRQLTSSRIITGRVSRGLGLVSHAHRFVRRLSAGEEEARIDKEKKMERNGSGG